MSEMRVNKRASVFAIAIAVFVVFLVLLVATAVLEEVTFGTHYVSSLYRPPIDWLIETGRSRWF
jgi:hypothetical protein